MFFAQSDPGPVRWAFTDRGLGNLALHVPHDAAQVHARRRRLADAWQLPPTEVVYLDQVHSARVVDADRLPAGACPQADASVSAQGRCLAVMVADCLPVLLWSQGQGPAVVAAAHAGRRGLLDGVLPVAVEAMRQRGAQQIRAVIGPSVCGQCYEVPEQMRAESQALMPGIGTTTSWGTPGLDLPGAALAQLRALGVEAGRCEAADGSSLCTLENPQLSSHRRDPASGRIAGVIHARAQEVPA